MNLSTLKFTDQSNGEVDGKKFKFVECEEMCGTCIFNQLNNEDEICGTVKCMSIERKDKKDGIFKFTTP